MSERKFQIVYGYAPWTWAVLEHVSSNQPPPIAFFDTFEDAVKEVYFRTLAPVVFDISDEAL